MEVRDEEAVTGIRILGPEQPFTGNARLLRFRTPYEVLSRGRYRVPAGTVVFTLKRGAPTIRRSAPYGFLARAGETYELRIDDIGPSRRITIVERSSGRIASPHAAPRRFLD
jgi:hypothetical protein